MLARRLTTILPAMTLAEAIETTRIHRVAGRTGDRTALVTTLPLHAPTTPSRMWGWRAGAPQPRPRHRGSRHCRAWAGRQCARAETLCD